MTTRPSIRKTANIAARSRLRWGAKWAGLTASVLLLALWVGSTWWYAWWITPFGLAFNIIGGRLAIGDVSGASPGVRPGWTFMQSPEWMPEWGFDWGGSGAGSLPFIAIPLWALAVPAVLATVLLWRKDAAARRRARIGACANCGYDLRGLGGRGVCPECGLASAPA